MTRSSVLLPCMLAVALSLAMSTTSATILATSPDATKINTAAATQFEIPSTAGTARVALTSPNVVHLSILVDGNAPARSTVLDPALKPDRPTTTGKPMTTKASFSMDTPHLHVHYDSVSRMLEIADASHRILLRTTDLAALAKGRIVLTHDASEPMYGVSGYDAFEKNVGAGILRSGQLTAKAGEQGWAGAPLVWSTAGYAVLADMEGGRVDLDGTTITLQGVDAKSMDVYLIVGEPDAIFDAVAKLSGPAPLFPKWAMGFTNSQWGIDQKELLQIVGTYRAKHIPIDNFTLDFDWKAWGEDDYGEFRWNPVKFPDGPTGALAKQMHALGMQITGIMKPRIHVDTVEGRHATEHHFWVPGEKVSDDYFSHKPVKDIDFDIPAARTWFGDLAVKYGFDHGIAGWWNDEADTTGSDSEFMNMQRALYDAQRRVSDLRVWSVNRNFYLGSQRYAYGLWSGDIDTGFASMAGQRARMLSAINVGAMQWGMDGGGFKGHPSDENYARWIEFGAFTPIFRVHGVFNEKRQPWVYGPVAEKAATDAIRLRYALIPYIYSYEHMRHTSGVGLIRPLLFDWPHDANVRNDVDAWMFGEGLLVSPVVVEGQKTKDIYLPAGSWTDWFSGKVYPGGQTIHYTVDSTHWNDIPLFVRQGAIIPTQPPMDYVGEHPLSEVSVEIFPASDRTTFDYYDDDGTDYGYENGSYFSQTLATQRSDNTVTVETGAVSGSYKPALKFYLLKIHGSAASKVSGGGTLTAFANVDALQHSGGEGWASGKDRFGAVTYVRVAAAKAQRLALTLEH